MTFVAMFVYKHKIVAKARNDIYFRRFRVNAFTTGTPFFFSTNLLEEPQYEEGFGGL